MKIKFSLFLPAAALCAAWACLSTETRTLRQIADEKEFAIGVLLNPHLPLLRRVEQREFNLGIVTFDWKSFVWSDGSIDWSWMDAQVREAKEAGMRIRFQHLLFSHVYPDWLKDKASSLAEFEAFMKSVIVQVMTRYKNDIQEWVVVNEPQNPPYVTDDIFYHAYGGYDYIDVAFQTAHETDPDAILIYNNTDNHRANGQTTPVSRMIVRRLKAKNLIDGIGVQMHVYAPQPATKQDMIDTLQSYGLPVYVTEFDVDLRGVQGTRDERFAVQAQDTRIIIEACLESGVCRSFSTWGIGDKYSWLENPQFNASSDADATLFDDDLNPKPAYFVIRDALSRF